MGQIKDSCGMRVAIRSAVTGVLSLRCEGVARYSLPHWSMALWIMALTLFWAVALEVNSARAATKDAAEPKVHAVQVLDIAAPKELTSATKMTVALEIRGAGFGASSGNMSVGLLGPTGENAADAIQIRSVDDKKIVFSADVPQGTYRVKLNIRGVEVDTSKFPLTLKAAPPPPAAAPKEFEIKYKLHASEEYTNLWTLVITSETNSFSPNRNNNQVTIIPAGASNVAVQSNDPRQIVLTFMAPAKFEVKDLIVTVYNNSDLDSRQPLAMSKPFKEKAAPSDPNQPTITNGEVMFLERNKGFGRLVIEGNGFGQYPQPPLLSEDYLRCCAPRYALAVSGKASAKPEVIQSWVQEQINQSKDEQAEWEGWQETIKEKVKVDIVPRNPALRVERVIITYVDDKLIDVYFEFTYYEGYSEPFRLARTIVSINKPGLRVAQTVTAGTVQATVGGPQSYTVSKDFGPKRDENLEYSYTVISKEEANRVLGRGISENYYVIQLSVINKGAKKVAIPLGAIKAEIEWAYGSSPTRREEIFYEEGPATLPPTPLALVTNSFDAYNKVKGKRAVLFNIFEGVTTLGAALIPIFGPGFKDGHVIFTGGLVPGVRRAIGDLSGQQLQALTALSWQDVEFVPAGGAPLNKYVYIQRGEQVFSTPRPGNVMPNVKKEIKNLLGIEVVGFEVTESEAKTATQVEKPQSKP